MKNIKILIGLSLLIVFAIIGAIAFLDKAGLSGYGSIISAGGSLLAVIWFTASLWYQSTQLKEQRIQFHAQFEHLKESSRRDSLQTAKIIIDSAEEGALSMNGNVSSIADLVSEYQMFHELKTILESNDPNEVLDAYRAWMKKEGAAITFLKGLKDAAEIYFKSAGIRDIDYSKNPVDFVFIYGCHFWNQPFFGAYQGSVNILCEFMVRLEPGRNAAQIAFFAANSKILGEKLFKMDKIREDIAQHTAQNYPLPKIAENL